MSTSPNPTLTPYNVTEDERAMIELMRTTEGQNAERVLVPKVYLDLLTSSFGAMKNAIAKAQYAADLTESLIGQTSEQPSV